METMTLLPGVSMKAAEMATSAQEDIALIKRRLRISGAQLAAMLGVSKSEVCRWEKGTRTPKCFNAVRLHEQARLLREQS